ncbi:MAG: hypothetical protein ACXABD_10335 [Candidatus Thorarchaeota archaeon]
MPTDAKGIVPFHSVCEVMDMSRKPKVKNKLFKGLTEHDVLTWEEEKMRYQRKMGQKVTDLQFLRYLLMMASRPVISTKDGVKGGFLTGQGPIYEKGETVLDRHRSQRLQREITSDSPKRTKIPRTKV